MVGFATDTEFLNFFPENSGVGTTELATLRHYAAISNFHWWRDGGLQSRKMSTLKLGRGGFEEILTILSMESIPLRGKLYPNETW